MVGFYDRLGYALYSGVGPVAITAESSTPALAAFAEVYSYAVGRARIPKKCRIRQKHCSLTIGSNFTMGSCAIWE